MEDFIGLRNELRNIIHNMRPTRPQEKGGDGNDLARALNIYLFGPEASGKTSFIRTCFRAMMDQIPGEIENLEVSLHRSEEGTSLYSFYHITRHIRLHDTRGQREFNPDEVERVRLVLEGRAKPNSLITQRKRYWLLLREFWRTEDRMKRTFSKQVMHDKISLDTEPHFVFLVIDPNQQEMLIQDEGFRTSYSDLLHDLKAREVPFAILCTHGDEMNPEFRRRLMTLPKLLGIENKEVPQIRTHGDTPTPNRKGVSSFLKTAQSTLPEGSPAPLPDPFRVITNYTGPLPSSIAKCGEKLSSNAVPTVRYPPRYPRPPVDGAPRVSEMKQLKDIVQPNDPQNDIQTLLILLDAVRQADFHVDQRLEGKRAKPKSMAEDDECSIL